MESPRSPKRRRILSSINPPETNAEDDAPRHAKRDRTMTPDGPAPRGDEARVREDNTEDGPEPQDHDNTEAPRPTKFRFKSKSSRSSRRREGDDDDRHHHRHRSRSRSRSRDRDRHRDRHKDDRARSRDRDDDSRERRRHRRKHRDPGPDDDKDKEKSHRHHHHRRRKHRSKYPSAPAPQQDQDQNPFQDAPLSPTTAFRESLFDAMADDEGAAYWESVYGQPIHIYAPPNSHSTSANGSTLEHMTDDEYAAYVRQKMWEKTHAGLLEARARREREKEEARKKEEEKGRVAREMERCLRRGEERRRRKGWRERWEGYVRRWAEWEEAAGKGGGVEGIPWPVEVSSENGEGGIQGEAVRAFFVNALGLEELGEEEFAARLKEERVRWHPDKVQQRLGGQVEEKVMRDVTAIFQAVDALWNDTRKSGR
ncbi:hypothetical protein C8A01DRAFT_12562 [Parachaetomium inaequale]|uniref:J domain-containing protein n=1 Tax=Parachaetomium inaequale TaxID=2588326 RepID=A0AAN6SVD5_9PEZI|nr:hypothetical protein C8A01DRAFT_12562 [Parachaetomium inaequale]